MRPRGLATRCIELLKSGDYYLSLNLSSCTFETCLSNCCIELSFRALNRCRRPSARRCREPNERGPRKQEYIQSESWECYST